MRIAIVTESFLPSVNGVTTSVCRILEELANRGHEAIVIAPGPAPQEYCGFRVHAVTSVPVRQFQVGLPSWEIESILADFDPDVLHAASPFLLGAQGIIAGHTLRIPTVALYQTDMAAYLEKHGGVAGKAWAKAAWKYLRWVHSTPDVNLAPSSAAINDLHAAGIERTALWERGVDGALFNPRRRDEPDTRALRRRLAPRGETIVTYVGRIAPEKELHRLEQVAKLPGVSLSIVGDGPARAEMEALLPGATFLGRRSGAELAAAYASADVFVHTGTHETFGQTIQEASATGLPVVAPRAGGPIDLVDHGTTGLLFDPADPHDIVSCVRQLTTAEDSWELRALMGEAARAKVAPRTWSALVDKLLGYYASVMRTASQV